MEDAERKFHAAVGVIQNLPKDGKFRIFSYEGLHDKFSFHTFAKTKLSAKTKILDSLLLLLGNFKFLWTFVVLECVACNWELLLFWKLFFL